MKRSDIFVLNMVMLLINDLVHPEYELNTLFNTSYFVK